MYATSIAPIRKIKPKKQPKEFQELLKNLENEEVAKNPEKFKEDLKQMREKRKKACVFHPTDFKQKEGLFFNQLGEVNQALLNTPRLVENDKKKQEAFKKLIKKCFDTEYTEMLRMFA